MSSDPEQESQLYFRILYPLRHGCPLWIPEPNYNLPVDHWQIGVQIGDVGLITEDGGFDYIFNACKPADHALNQRNGVPEGFVPLLWDEQIHHWPEIFQSGKAIYSRGGRKMDLSVEGNAAVFGLPASVGGGVGIAFDRSKGAVLMPGVRGASRVNSQNKRVFREYALKNGIAWYQFVNGPLGREAGNGEIFIITGVDKTNSWELAVAQNSSSNVHCQFVFTVPGVGEGGLKLSHAIRSDTQMSSRTSTNEDHHNQTLFVRGFRVSIRLGLRGRLMSKVKVSETYPLSLMDTFARSFGGGVTSLGDSSQFTGTSSASQQSLGDSSSRTSQRSKAEPAESSHSSDNTASVYETASEYEPETGSEYEDIVPKMYHPLISINDYILESNDRVEVVATHDDDLLDLLDNEQDYTYDGVPSTDILISRLNDRMKVVVDDLGTSGKFIDSLLQSLTSGTGHAIIVPKRRTILNFPDLVVQRILSHLPHHDILVCSQVCRKFVLPTRYFLFHGISLRDGSLLDVMASPITFLPAYCVKEVKIAGPGAWNEVIQWEGNLDDFRRTIFDILYDVGSLSIDNWGFPLTEETRTYIPGTAWSSVRKLKVSNIKFRWYGHIRDIVGVFSSAESLELEGLQLDQIQQHQVETQPKLSLPLLRSMKLDVDPGVIEHLVPSPELQRLECKIPSNDTPLMHPYVGRSIGRLLSSAGDSLEVVLLAAKDWTRGGDFVASSFEFIKFGNNPNLRELRLSIPDDKYLIPFLEELGKAPPRALETISIEHLLGYERDWSRLDALLVSPQFSSLGKVKCLVRPSTNEDVLQPEDREEATRLKKLLPSLTSRGLIQFLSSSRVTPEKVSLLDKEMKFLESHFLGA